MHILSDNFLEKHKNLTVAELIDVLKEKDKKNLKNQNKMNNNFNIGDTVVKKSDRPFKNGEKTQTITGFGINEIDPNKRPCAVFSDGSICNLDMLKKLVFIDIETDVQNIYFGNRSMGVSQGIPTGFLTAFSGSRKSNLLEFLPNDVDKNEYRVVVNDINNLDKITIQGAASIIDLFKLGEMKKHLESIEENKDFKVVHEKIGNSVFPITYFSDGFIIVDYPTKL